MVGVCVSCQGALRGSEEVRKLIKEAKQKGMEL